MAEYTDETAVPCPYCGAAVGERCVTSTGYRYYVGWGHSLRGSALVAARREQVHDGGPTDG